MRAALVALPLILLSACDQSGPSISLDTRNESFSVDAKGAGTDGLSIQGDQGKLALKLPGLDAKIDVPGMNIGGDHMDVDGMKVHPGTKLSGMALDGSDAGGMVRLRFTDPATPQAVIAHYVREAPGAGYTIEANGPDRVSGVKLENGKESRFDIVARGVGGGSEGTITIAGK